jgi:hypothetical protein
MIIQAGTIRIALQADFSGEKQNIANEWQVSKPGSGSTCIEGEYDSHGQGSQIILRFALSRILFDDDGVNAATHQLIHQINHLPSATTQTTGFRHLQSVVFITSLISDLPHPPLVVVGRIRLKNSGKTSRRLRRCDYLCW